MQSAITCAWRDDEVELELALIAVVDDVDAGVDVAIFDLRVAADTRAPQARIVADQVVREAWQHTAAAALRAGRRAHEPHHNCAARPFRRRPHGQPGLAFGEIQRVPAPRAMNSASPAAAPAARSKRSGMPE